jgi:hypothetical protein
MAKLEAIQGSTTLTLMDTTVSNNTYTTRVASGIGGAPVRRLTTAGAAQQGDSDVGYRLDPRNVTLFVGFRATTDALLDGYRDTLTGFFKPLSATLINLRLTRDDGEIRQLDVYTRGKIDIKWVKEHRLGHYHEATIVLRAAQPAWYELAPGTVTVTGVAGTAADWYLAGGAIGTAQVMMSGGTPAQGATWSYAGSIDGTTSWTLALRAAQETIGAANKYMFYVDNSELTTTKQDITLRAGTNSSGGSSFYANGTAFYSYALGSAFMPAAITNYFIRHDVTGLITDSSGIATTHKDLYMPGFNSSGTVDPGFGTTPTRPIAGATRRWRSDAANSVASRWASTLHLYALYSPGLSYGQMTALDAYMAGAVGGTTALVVSIPYEGDLPEYPVISITGPITGANIVNTETAEILNFGTNTIAALSTYIIDTRPGVKTVLYGTVNKRGELASYSKLDTWHLTPDTTTPHNIIYVTGTNTSAATSVSIVYYNRFSSY